jgi:hypothetical protein
MSVSVDQRRRYQRRSGHLAPEKVTSSFSSALLSLFSTRRKRRSTSNGCASKSHLGSAIRRSSLPRPGVLQLGVEKARLRRGTRCRVGRHPRRRRRIQLCQDALEPLDPWREDEALTVDRGADRPQDLGAFFSGKIQCWHCGNVGCPRSGTNSNDRTCCRRHREPRPARRGEAGRPGSSPSCAKPGLRSCGDRNGSKPNSHSPR